MSARNLPGCPIAVVGVGCWYPGARGPRELWENVLARRAEFRRIPECRLPLADYHDPDRQAPDKTYGRRAAVIDGFSFDWASRRIPQSTFAGTDVVQWLALEVARQALEDTGIARDALPRERTGVVVGNTLTGEQTRAQSLRLRWPFVRRALVAAADARGLPPRVRDELAAAMEGVYKSAFAPVTEDTLAGGLSNTIAGRICNFFDIHGGGYVVDGACASSLLAVCTAADRLAGGDLDLALAGGVDISLDTFELIGFAKTGALTPDEMRVYDRRANGFIPGEGCGFVALKRLADARAAGDAVLAVLRGWGVSSDGKGGMTAPNRDGQARAIRRAYRRAGYGPAALDFVEGHGTGTRVGDRTELEAIAAVLREAGVADGRRCGVTSFKSLFGHTKAAAGVGAFIKAVLAVNRRVLPATGGCAEPNDVFDGPAANLYPIRHGQALDAGRTVRAGVSAMGFGGINAHVTVESADPPAARFAPSADERSLLASHQDTEVFPLAADDPDTLARRASELAATAERLSAGELTDLAARLGSEAKPRVAYRAAVVASSPDDLAQKLRAVAARLRLSPPTPGETAGSIAEGWWVGRPSGRPRIGFLFPGQGSQQLGMGRVFVERFGWARELAAAADRWLTEAGLEAVTPFMFRPTERTAGTRELEAWARDLARTEVAQPAICLASLLHARNLMALGLRPTAVGGHSLGELSAFHAAGAFGPEALLKLAGLRGRAMAAPPERPGAMASLACDRERAEALLRGATGYVVVANRNGPRQTVVSGDEAAVAWAVERATKEGVAARRLAVSNAFHCELVAGAAARLAAAAPVPEAPAELWATVVSGIDGRAVDAGVSLPSHFARQAVKGVDFVALLDRMKDECELLVEVGPGRVLSGLAADTLGPAGPPCLPVASKPEADRDLNAVLATAFARGADVRWAALYEGRLVRPFVAPADRVFIENPCERPFAVPAVPPAVSQWEAALAGDLGCGPDELAGYLSRRRAFLAAVVRVDMASLPVAASGGSGTPEPVAEVPAYVPPVERPGRAEQPDADGLESLLVDLAAERTGFSRQSITPASRLLDDLNLDSIKAGELVAEAAKRVGVAGKLDPSRLATASLAEVAAALREAGGEAAAPPSPVQRTTPAAPPRVRDFVIEYIPQA